MTGESAQVSLARGIELKFWGVFLSSFIGIFVKLVDASVLDIGFLAMLITAIAFGCALYHEGVSAVSGDWVRPHAWKLLCRGPIQVAIMLLTLYALKELPLGDATVMLQSAPIYTAILAWILLGESVGAFGCLCLVSTLLGSFLVSKADVITCPNPLAIVADADGEAQLAGCTPATESSSPAVAAALCAAVLAAIDNVLLRSISVGSSRVPPLVTIFSYGFQGTLLLGAAMLLTGERVYIPLHGWQALLVVLLIVVYYADTFVSVLAYKYAPATVLALIGCSSAVFAYLWQILLFGQTPSTAHALGALIVLASLCALTLHQYRSVASRTDTSSDAGYEQIGGDETSKTIMTSKPPSYGSAMAS